jgi:hypothetical protein
MTTELRRGWWLQNSGRVAYLCDEIDGWWYGRGGGGSPRAWRQDGSSTNDDPGESLDAFLGNGRHAPCVANNGYKPESIKCPSA